MWWWRFRSPAAFRRSSVVGRQTKKAAALNGVAALFFLAAVWFWKVESDHQAGQLLMLPVFVLQIVADRWEVEELWRRPEEATAKAAYRRIEIIEWVLAAALLGGVLALLFLSPDGAVAWWAGFPVLLAASYAARRWSERARAGLLERVPAPDPALAIPPPFRY